MKMDCRLKMRHLAAFVLVIAVTVKADKIFFPDEIDKITQSGIYYSPISPNAARYPAASYPMISESYDNNYQTRPPPSSPITRPDQLPSNYNDVQPTPLATLANMLPPFWRNHVNNIISRGVLKFALDMDRAISDTSVTRAEDLEKNVVFSPLSLAGTMAMVLLASGGRTFDEVAKILGLQSGVDISRHSELVHQMFGSLIEQINTKRGPGEPVANYASGIFVQDGFSIRPEFQEISQKVYKSEVVNLDFQNRPKQAQDFINKWVNNKTFGKIRDILQYPPDEYTRVILASALYFNGEWSQYFIDSATKRKPFFIEMNKSVDVDMMYNGGQFPFYEDKRFGVKILGLPYKGREVTMYLVLPTVQGASALKRFEGSLTPEIIETLIDSMRNETCIIGLPRMKLSSTLNLKDALKYLGLVSLFEPNMADLSLLSPGREYTNRGVSSRFSDTDEPVISPSLKRNFFKYKTDKYSVEQWATGFHLRRLKRRVSQLNRQVRQHRPIDQDFLDFVNSQNFPTYGLDNLRNSHTTVNPHLYAEDVLHKVEIDINEKGTEAAAATAVTINRSGGQRMFIANRPFLFFIRHDPSKLIWFWGTVNKPDPHY